MTNLKTNNIKCSVSLFSAAFIWGIAFVFQAMGNNYMHPFTFTAARSFIGFLLLLPFAIHRYKKFKANNNVSIKTTLIGGLLCGIAIAGGTLMQQIGVQYTTIGKAGFITALYIIFTPIIGIFLKRKCPYTVWISAIGATIGLYLLCMTESLTICSGDVLVLIGSIIFAVHILFIDYFSTKIDAVVLSCIQFFVCFLITGVLSLLFASPTISQLQDGLIPVLYAGVMSYGVGYTCQIIGQKNFNPTAAAVILSLESVVSAIAGFYAFKFGFIQTNQTLTIVQIIGCAIVFISVLFVQIPLPSKQKQK